MMQAPQNRTGFQFGKDYKLCSKALIDQLFAESASVKEYPFVCRYRPTELTSNTSFQIAISVPKRMVKSAVMRNRIKRLCRESIRLNKVAFEQSLKAKNVQLALFLIYTSKDEENISLLQIKITRLFDKILNALNQAEKTPKS